MEGNSISIKELISRVKRHKMLASLNEEYIIDYAVDFLRIVGIPESFDEKYAVLEIKDYCAKLPDDCLEVIAVRSYPKSELLNMPEHCYKPAYYKKATGLFHTSPNKRNYEPYVYKTQGNLIYTSAKETKIEIKYQALDVDDCGFPLLPDNATYLRAVESYIKLQHFTDLFDEGKLAMPIYQNAQQDYSWNVAQVSTAMRKITPDKLETLANIMKANIIRDNEHQSGFAHTGRNTRTVIH